MEHRVQCAEIFGGIKNVHLDICTSGVMASIFATACEGDQGGDVYYFSVCSADVLTRLAVADMRGHGAEVTKLSNWLYGCLQTQMNTLNGHAILEDLNRTVHQKGFQAITTAAVLGYYAGDSNLYFSYAGHPPALLRCSTTGSWDPLELLETTTPANLPLGVFADTRYEQASVKVSSGDRVFVYTDGIVECPSADGEEFGEERLCHVLGRSAGLPLQEIREAVKNAMIDHNGGAMDHDDCTFMVLEIR